MKLTSKIKEHLKENKKRWIAGAGGALCFYLTFLGAINSVQYKGKLLSKLEKPVMSENVQKLNDLEMKFNTEVRKIECLKERKYQLDNPNLFTNLEESVNSLRDQYSNEKNLNDSTNFRRDLEDYNSKVHKIKDLQGRDLIYIGIPFVGGMLSYLTAVGAFKK